MPAVTGMYEKFNSLCEDVDMLKWAISRSLAAHVRRTDLGHPASRVDATGVDGDLLEMIDYIAWCYYSRNHFLVLWTKEFFFW